jgi:hypothetical protein
MKDIWSKAKRIVGGVAIAIGIGAGSNSASGEPQAKAPTEIHRPLDGQAAAAHERAGLQAAIAPARKKARRRPGL